MKIKIAMALMSLDYMGYLGIILGAILTGDIEHALMNAEYFYITSFLGSLLFLFEARRVLPQWYLAIPFSIVSFLQVIQFFMAYYGIGFIEHYLMRIPPAILMEIPVVLLSVSSILVFLSLHNQPVSTKLYMIILSILCIISFVGLFDHNRIGLYPLMSLYWAFGMPIIGICFLVKAITYKNPRNNLSQFTLSTV